MAVAFYKGIKDPDEIRRSLLECSRDVIKSLQNNIEYSSLRERKATAIIKLKKDVEEINELYEQLNLILPEEEKENTQIRKTKRKRTKYNIKDLSEELSDIE